MYTETRIHDTDPQPFHRGMNLGRNHPASGSPSRLGELAHPADASMYDRVRYSKPFLKEVILRVDFAAPQKAFTKTLPDKVANAALLHFPIAEPVQALAQELQITPREVKQKRSEFTEWNFHGREREKRLAISPLFIFTTHGSYRTYEELKQEFLAVMEVLFAEFPDLRASRMGLRYINNIDIEDTDPLKWDRYIDASLLCLFSRFHDPDHLTRLFHIVEFKYDDLQVKLQFGLPNPDFPAVIRKPIFILDVDGYVQGLQDLADIKVNVDHAHAQVQRLFEQSITDDLRELMNARQGK